jgi:hypothetical protein
MSKARGILYAWKSKPSQALVMREMLCAVDLLSYRIRITRAAMVRNGESIQSTTLVDRPPFC